MLQVIKMFVILEFDSFHKYQVQIVLQTYSARHNIT